MGVPVFISDVKGDVSGVAMPGTPSDKLQQRAAQTGAENFATEASPSFFGICTASLAIRCGPRSAKLVRRCWREFWN